MFTWRVISLAMSAWVKKTDDFPGLGVFGRKVRTFPAIAVPAGKRKIVRCRFPVMLLGDDVICLVRLVSVVFVDEAVLTTTTGTRPNGVS